MTQAEARSVSLVTPALLPPCRVLTCLGFHATPLPHLHPPLPPPQPHRAPAEKEAVTVQCALRARSLLPWSHVGTTFSVWNVPIVSVRGASPNVLSATPASLRLYVYFHKKCNSLTVSSVRLATITTPDSSYCFNGITQSSVWKVYIDIHIHVRCCSIQKKGQTLSLGSVIVVYIYCSFGKYFQHLSACFKYYSIVIISSNKSYPIFMK